MDEYDVIFRRRRAFAKKSRRRGARFMPLWVMAVAITAICAACALQVADLALGGALGSSVQASIEGLIRTDRG